jgi:hypothetical protein
VCLSQSTPSGSRFAAIVTIRPRHLARSKRRARVSFELHGRRTIVAAIERGVLDPLPETGIVPQFSADLCAEMAGVCIYKTGRQTSTATVTVNKLNASGAHLPRLLNYPTEGRSGCCVRVTGYVGRVISLQIDRDLGEHQKRSPSSPDKLSLTGRLRHRGERRDLVNRTPGDRRSSQSFKW